jgi:glycogen debranching enzyme
MPDIVTPEEQFAIISEGERVTTPPRVLKHGESFAVFEPHGDVTAGPGSEHGLYHRGTRFLSRFELLLANRQPLLLSASVSDDNAIFTADLTNADIVADGHVLVARGSLHVYRSRVLWNGTWLEVLRVSNHALHAVDVPLAVRIDADFVDVFEVRGTTRPERGPRLPLTIGPELVLRYQGLDGVQRRTRVRLFCEDATLDDHSLRFRVALEPHASLDIEIAISCELDDEVPPIQRYREVVATLRQQTTAGADGRCHVLGSNHGFNRWFQRSAADLRMMMTDTPHGIYPYAGIPWFSTPFGRDGIITALEMLWAAPEVARGVLAFLADTQATSRNDAQDAQPGKILHEMREGEMAALGEIPFARYYGTADATPLFVMLAHAYYERTGDGAFIDRLWPHVLAALDWLTNDGDPDRDGFIEYARRSDSGLVQQGWKDSWDSVFHADGTLADAPIALCEIQGYAYAAWLGAAKLAAARGERAWADEWHDRAATLKTRFDEAFWCEEIGTYALALDARKERCRVRTSNPGHCLFTGIVSPSRAARLAETLMADSSFGGWGVRTVASGCARYNPMSYHNGSVWPHDNALVAAGLARYGFTAAASRIFGAMFDLSQAVDLQRLPELICGFHRRAGCSPTLYPVACAPQAWAAGAVYLLVQACLGLQIDATARRISFVRAVLPDDIEWLRLINMPVGAASTDLLLTRHGADVAVNVLRRDGDVEIVVVK